MEPRAHIKWTLKRGGVILFDCKSKRGGVIEATYFRTRKFELRSK